MEDQDTLILYVMNGKLTRCQNGRPRYVHPLRHEVQEWKVNEVPEWKTKVCSSSTL